MAYTASELVLHITAMKSIRFLIARETDSKVKLRTDAPPRVYNLDFRYCKGIEPNLLLKHCSGLPNDNTLEIEFLELEPITNNLDKTISGNLANVSKLDVYKNRMINLYSANQCFAVLFKTEIPDIDYMYYLIIMKHKPSGRFFLVRINEFYKIDSYFINSWGVIPVTSRYASQWSVIFGSDAILVIPQKATDDFLKSIIRKEHKLQFEDNSHLHVSSPPHHLEVSQSFRVFPSRKWNGATGDWRIEPRDIISFRLSGYRQHFYFNKKILFKIENYTRKLEERLGIFTRVKH